MHRSSLQRNMEINFKNIKLEQLNKFSQKLLNSTKLKLWFIYGDLGAGKTTLIKNICKNLDVIDNVTSPTFSIINEYRTKNNEIIYHFDLYRLNDEKELFNIGIEEYICSKNYCFIEWPHDKIEYFPHNKLFIETIDNDSRNFKLKIIDF